MRAPGPRRAVLLIGLAVCAVGLSTTLPLPLYVEYARRGGHGAGALALAFACYATTAIVTAPLLGPLPDRIGRKPCVLLAVLLAALSSLVLSIAPGLPALALARTAQGLAMGCITGAAAAWAAELAGGEREGGRRAAAVIATATVGSFGIGGVLTLGALLAWPGMEPPPTYPLHLLFVLLLLWPIACLPETLARPGGAWLRWPAFPRGTLPTTLAILPGWGVTGTVLTSVPAALAAQGMPLAGAVAVCVMILVGVLVQQGLHRLDPRRAVRLGLVVLCAGAGLTLWGAATGRLWPLLLGGGITGTASYGFIYLGGLASVAEAAGGDRARAVAGYFVVAHLGFSVVPLAVGFAVDALGAGAALGGLWGLVALSALLLIPAIRRVEVSARSG
ncbi:MAG: MFS transporter [Acetobacteraceae bacterium]|nr:MFS transporter [Acetobacteraceae bacterium]